MRSLLQSSLTRQKVTNQPTYRSLTDLSLPLCVSVFLWDWKIFMTLRRSARQLSIAILTFEQTFGLQGRAFGIHENILKSGWAGNWAQCCAVLCWHSTQHSAQHNAQCSTVLAIGRSAGTRDRFLCKRGLSHLLVWERGWGPECIALHLFVLQIQIQIQIQWLGWLEWVGGA